MKKRWVDYLKSNLIDDNHNIVLMNSIVIFSIMIVINFITVVTQENLKNIMPKLINTIHIKKNAHMCCNEEKH